MNVHIHGQLYQLSKMELLEVAKIMHEENVKLVSENKMLEKLISDYKRIVEGG